MSTTTKPLFTGYEFDSNLFNTAISKANLSFILSPLSMPEARVFSLKPGFNSACWTYSPPHQIYIGEDILKNPQLSGSMTTKDKSTYIENFVHHELAHAVFTEKDLRSLNEKLISVEIAFPFFNLAEDARIEHLYRELSAYRFNWLSFENFSFSLEPSSILFGLIQAEGDVSLLYDYVNKEMFKSEADLEPVQVTLFQEPVSFDNQRDAQLYLIDRVLEYYRKFISKAGAYELIPVILEWLKEFTAPPPSISTFPQDLSLSLKLNADSNFKVDFDKDTYNLDEKTPLNSQAESEYEEVSANSDDFCPTASNGQVLAMLENKDLVNFEKARLIAKRLEPWFKSTTRAANVNFPTNRPSVRHFAIGMPLFKKKRDEGRGPKNIVVVLDLSGSMDGFHIKEGLTLILALSYLAKKGLVSGHVVFSGVSSYQSIYETYALPVNPRILLRAEAVFHAEGLEANINSNLTICKQADFLFVYTDGSITDRPIEKSKLHAMGIQTIGLYAGTSKDSTLRSLLTYFDKAIIRSDALEIADAIITQI